MSKTGLGLPERTAPRARGGCRRIGLVVISLIGLAVLGGSVFLYKQQRDRMRAQFEPPIVFVTEPVSGASAPLGSNLFVSATGFGNNPIVRTELWVDGELKATQNSGSPNGTTTFNAHYDFRMAEGAHLLFVRAVDSMGMIGQSEPAEVASKLLDTNQPPYRRIQVQADETLLSIAQLFGTDTTTLLQLNPQLSGQEPTVDAPLTVPIPAQPAAPVTIESAPVLIPNTPPLQVVEPSPFDVDFNLVLGFFVMQPPAAPSNLQAQVTDCKVRLLWNDNATNESSYEVWMAGSGLPPLMIAKLKPAGLGPAWVEFPAPRAGALSFWVQAVNLLGQQLSNIVWVSVDSKCPATPPTPLQIEALDMVVSGSYDRVYCYVSFENAPETRVPGDSNQFISVQGGKGDIGKWAAGNKKFLVSIPADGTLTIVGECWGWSGKSLNKLGTFSSTYSAGTWDGRRQTLGAGDFQISIAIQSLGSNPSGTPVLYSYTDPTIPIPYAVAVVGESLGVWSSSGSNKTLGDPQERTLTWEWAGDPKTIDGFKIYLDGKLYSTGWLSTFPLIANPNERQVKVRQPACGKKIRWQVSAYKGEAESNLSKPSEVGLPECPVYANVTFKTIGLSIVDGTCFPPSFRISPCDTISVYMLIFANDVTRKGGIWWADLYAGPKSYQMTCGSYSFKQILQTFSNEPEPDIIRVPLYGAEPTLKFGTRFHDTSDCGAGGFGWDTTLTMPRDQWVKYNQNFSKWVGGGNGPGVFGMVDIEVKGYEVP